MPTTPDIEAIIHALQSAADPGRRAAMTAYLRNQFEFLGIGTPARRAATRALYKSMKWNDADELVEQAMP